MTDTTSPAKLSCKEVDNVSMTERSVPAEIFDVAIVGYGPSGATLANLLALSGLKVLVLEREVDLYHLPRAVHFDDEVMRIFGLAGIADELIRKIRVNPGMRFVDADGSLLMDWPRPQEIGPNGWHASYRFHQPDLERLLRDAVSRHETATVVTRAEVSGLDDQRTHVEIHYDDLDEGQTRSICARYVVGCDGARSFVRQCMGTEMENLGFEERWLVVDALLKRPMPELGDFSIQHCDPVRPMTYCRSPENRRRWEIKILAGDDVAEISTPAAVWDLLSRWIAPGDADLERTAIYTFRSAIARSWRSGRLLLAGDAAHLTPPFMGQGMCAGIRDVSNLAWKLAECVRSAGSDAILDTYQSERSPHVREYISTAIRLGGLINTLDREGAMDLARSNGDGRSRMRSISPRLGNGLSVGRTEHRGRIFPNAMLNAGERFDDVYRADWVLLARWSIGETVREGLVVLFATSGSELERCLDDLECDAVLIRPDKYILGTAESEEEIRDLIGFSPHSAFHALTTESELPR